MYTCIPLFTIIILKPQLLSKINKSWFPLGLEIRENLEKWEGIFQSGKSQGILSILEKSGNFAQNTGKTGKFE